MIHHAASAQDRHQIGAAHHFTDPVRDQADADAASGQIAQATYQTRYLTGTKHGSRLIQQQKAGILSQGDKQFAHLPFHDTQPAGRHVQRYGDAGTFRRRRKLAACVP